MFERLEQRDLLAGADLLARDSWQWFQSFDGVPRISPQDLQRAFAVSTDTMGPHELVASEWIVQLTSEAAQAIDTLASINLLLNAGSNNFKVVSGLGTEGLVLVRGLGVTTEDVQQVLATNPHVDHFSPNSLIEGQQIPNDPEFGGGGLPGLEGINASDAWNLTRGTSSVVVGVLDGGIDAAHPDLFLNIWLNQGEIPASIRDQLQDTDQDGLITFYDLNNLRVTERGIEVASTGDLWSLDTPGSTPFGSGPNRNLVSDLNGNQRIDAEDLLVDDGRWADGRDTDGNGFFDDLFGINFRVNGTEGLARNEPFDELGHGTHVAGTIGAIGNNGFGVTGVNWQTSLMSLRILDNANQSDAAAAITAVNYANAMRAQWRTDENGRVVSGANVRVLNNSWGQPGGFDQALATAIQQSDEQEILFVAAAGNGSAVSLQGIDNDRTPFFPASYESDNVLAVAALSADGDELAALSNFGLESVDIAAPGVTIRSTRPGGRFEAESGTSMATPHVAGAAALILASQPNATIDELLRAIKETVEPIPDGDRRLSTGGKLNVGDAINADVFAPAAQLINRNDIHVSGAISTEFTIQYRHRSGIDISTIETGDAKVVRQWGPRDELTASLIPGSIEVIDSQTVQATYEAAAPGGTWDPLDFGEYEISVLEDAVRSNAGIVPMRPTAVGAFDVLIREPGFFYVDTTRDGVDIDLNDGVAADANGAVTLRAAIQQANQDSLSDPSVQSTIFLVSGNYELTLAGADEDAAASGDLDVVGDMRIIGDTRGNTQVSSNVDDRLFEIRFGSSLELSRISLTNGSVSGDGGAILVSGSLAGHGLAVFDSVARSGGAIAVAGTGNLTLDDNSAIERNRSTFPETLSDARGGALFLASGSTAEISNTTVAENGGGGINQDAGSSLTLFNSTISTNSLTGLKLSGSASLDHVTIADNAQFGLSFGLEFFNIIELQVEEVATRIRVKNSLIEGNTLGSYPFLFPSENISISEGSNVVQRGGDDVQLVNDGILNFDVNDSGDITSRDALLVLQPLLDDSDAEGEATANSQSVAIDVNDDGVVTPLDALIILNEGRKKSGFNDTPIFDQPTDIFVSAATRSTFPLVANGSPSRHHPLRPGSLPIDAAGGGSIQDQIGQVRETPDVGAIEFTAGDLRATGKVFDDRNRDGIQNPGEVGVSNQLVFLDVDQDGELDTTEAFTRTAEDNPLTGNIDESGDFALFSELNGEASVRILPDPNWVISEPPIQRLSETSDRVGGNGDSGAFIPPFDAEEPIIRPPSISSTGRFIAFRTEANNLEGDFIDRDLNFRQPNVNAFKTLIGESGDRLFLDSVGEFSSSDAYFLLRANGSLEAIGELGTDPDEVDAPFEALALTPSGDVRALLEVGLEDSPDSIVIHTDDQVTRFSYGVTQNPRLNLPSNFTISGDGSSVAYTQFDLFDPFDPTPDIPFIQLLDTETGVFSQPIQSQLGGNPNDSTAFPSLNGDGSVLVFQSDATNLVSDDTNESTDIFRMQDGVVKRISVANDGRDIVGGSTRPMVSADGRYVVFQSDARLVQADTNFFTDIYIYSAAQDEVRLISIGDAGIASNGLNLTPALSADGRYILFSSFADNLIDGDMNDSADVFLATNPFLGVLRDGFGGTARIDGAEPQTLNFAITGRPGRIAGNVFHDIVGNGVKDLGELGIPQTVVYIDLNRDGERDATEPNTLTDSGGAFVFDEFPSNQTYRLSVESPSGFEPAGNEPTSLDFFLPADGNIIGRDFPFVQVIGSGQSTRESTVSGRVYRDVNVSGEFDDGDIPLEGQTVFLDTDNIGIKDSNEPRVVTDNEGRFVINDLPNMQAAVTVELDHGRTVASPRGNDFQADRYPVFSSPRSFGRPYDVVSAPFNDDPYPDVALIHFDSNAISIRLNDGSGGFLADELDFDLGNEGGQPTALVTGQFNGAGTGLDVAVTNYATGKVIAMYDFDGTKFDASKTAVIDVGDQPLDLVAAPVTADQNHLDLVIVNQRDGTIQLLTNQGDNGFVAQNPVDTGGVDPVSIAFGHFTSDAFLDLAVVHLAMTEDATQGDVRILGGNATGGFELLPSVYSVGASPTDLVVGNFDGDASGKLDLAVANSNSNSIWILTGRGDGTFDVNNSDEDILGTAVGVTNIAVADVDGDGDADIVSGSPQFGDVSVFRNNSRPGEIEFQPLEGVGTGAFSAAQRLPIVLDNFDLDEGGIDGNGTVDLLSLESFTAATLTTTLSVRLNTLINGAHRVSLTGLNSVTDLDFIVEPALLLPHLDPIADPSPIVEDAEQQSLLLTGIAMGRDGGPSLQIDAISSNTDLIPDPLVEFVAGESTAILRYSPVAQSSGVSTVTVTVRDAGADGVFGTTDDGIAQRTFDIRVLAVEDRTIVLTGDGNTLFLGEVRQPLDSIRQIDIRGTGENTLVLDASVIRDEFDDSQIEVLADSGDSIEFGTGWQFSSAVEADARLMRRFSNDGATLLLSGPVDYHNPIDAFDVNAVGGVSALDALLVINELNRRSFSSDTNGGQIRPIGEVNLANFRFYDVNASGTITALDALQVINRLNEQASASTRLAGEVIPEVRAKPNDFRARDAFFSDFYGTAMSTDSPNHVNSGLLEVDMPFSNPHRPGNLVATPREEDPPTNEAAPLRGQINAALPEWPQLG